MKTLNKKQQLRIFKRDKNLALYFFYCFIDFIFLLFRIAFLWLFPIIVVAIVFLFIVICKVDTSFESSLSWGLFAACSAFFAIAISVILAVYSANKKYFKKNALSLFGSYKLFGSVDLMVVGVLNVLNIVIAFVSTIVESKYSNLYSLSSILYTLIIIVVAVVLMSKNNKKKYLRYLKNSGVLKKKRRSNRMDQNYVFIVSHPKVSKLGEKLWFIRDLSQYVHDSSAADYFKAPYEYKDKNLFVNIELLAVYFSECSKYISTDMDIVRLMTLIRSINNTLIDFLIKEKEFDILKDLLESLLIFSAYSLLSERIYNVVLCSKELEITDFKNDLEYGKYLLSLNRSLKNINELWLEVLNCFVKVKDLKPKSNQVVQELQKQYSPVYEHLKEKKRNTTNKD